jgi:hypothetical protein
LKNQTCDDSAADGADPFLLDESVVYKCDKSLLSGLVGRHRVFRMRVGEEEWTVVRQGPVFEVRQSPNGTICGFLLMGNRNCDFSLRLNCLHGDEVMTFSFQKCNEKVLRQITVHLSDGDRPQLAKSAHPRIGVLGNWTLDLGDGSALRSHKNCRLENADHSPAVYIRKYKKGGLEIEAADRRFTPMCLFALCIGSLLGYK